MAKIQQKSEKISAFGGIFFVLYRYIVALPLMAVLFGIKATDRLKSFLFRFIAVPAKWGQNGKAVQTQHLLQQAIQHYLGTRIGKHSSLMLRSMPLDLTG